MANEIEHIIAEGPEGLADVLNHLLKKSQENQEVAKVPQYILYQLGGQKALIKVDMSEKPYKFWHYDFLGRPATAAIKDTIATFLWEKCGIKEHFTEE